MCPIIEHTFLVRWSAMQVAWSPTLRQNGPALSMILEYFEHHLFHRGWHKARACCYYRAYIMYFTLTILYIKTLPFCRRVQWTFAWGQRLCLYAIPADTLPGTSNRPRESLQPCPCQNQGKDWDGLWPTEIEVPVPKRSQGCSRQGLWHYSCLCSLAQHCHPTPWETAQRVARGAMGRFEPSPSGQRWKNRAGSFHKYLFQLTHFSHGHLCLN